MIVVNSEISCPLMGDPSEIKLVSDLDLLDNEILFTLQSSVLSEQSFGNRNRATVIII